MEAIVAPRRWADFPQSSAAIFRALRSPEGEHMVLDENFFVEQILPRGMMRKLTATEMDAYRAPYRDRESRLPTLVWPRELPIDGEPADVVALVERYAAWLPQSPVAAQLDATPPRQAPPPERISASWLSASLMIFTVTGREVTANSRRANPPTADWSCAQIKGGN